MSRHPAERGDATRIANDITLIRLGRDGRRRGHVLVVAHRDHRAADAGAPQPRDDERRDDEHAEAQVVHAAPVREVDAADHRRIDARRGRAELASRSTVGWRNSQFEHITANASVITARNRPRARSAGMPMMIAATTPTSSRARRPPGATPSAKLHVPEVERHRDVEAGAEHDHRQRAEPDERELPERELAGPARERRDRQRDRARRSRSRSRGTAATAGDRKSGSTARKPNSTVKPSSGSRRTYQSDRSRSGIGLTCAESDQPGVVAAVADDEHRRARAPR